MKQIRVLAAASGENRARMKSLLEHESVNMMALMEPDLSGADRAAAMPVDAVVLMSQTLSSGQMAFMEKLYMCREKLALVLITDEKDADTLTAALSCGIDRVITWDLTPEEIAAELSGAVERTLSRSESAEVRQFDSRVISIFSTKGGTGKTTVAVNMAVSLRQLGKRVAIVDLDLQFGDVGIFLNLPKSDTISDLVSESTLTPSVVNSFLYEHSSGVFVLPAPESPELAELVKTEHVDKIITVLRAEFDYVVCDLAPTLDEMALFVLDRSDSVYFITNPEVPALKNAKTCLSLMGTLGLAEKIRLVLNKEGDPYVGRKDVENALDRKIYAGLPSDLKASSPAINRGIPCVSGYPKSKLARALADLARQEASPEEPMAAKKKTAFGRSKA